MTVQSSSVSQFPFAEVSAVAARGAGTFDAVVNPEWTIAGKPNGGYLLAMLGRAAASVSAHDHVIAASAHYLHAPDTRPGRDRGGATPGRALRQPDPSPPEPGRPGLRRGAADDQRARRRHRSLLGPWPAADQPGPLRGL